MAKVRVYELAKEFGVETEAVMAKLAESRHPSSGSLWRRLLPRRQSKVSRHPNRVNLVPARPALT
jgi:hypothetical protein